MLIPGESVVSEELVYRLFQLSDHAQVSQRRGMLQDVRGDCMVSCECQNALNMGFHNTRLLVFGTSI